MADESTQTCFFYGTLMSIQILCRVIGRTSDHLEFADAVLKGYTRHHLKGVDYPAVVPAETGTKVIGRALTDEEASVRGTVVTGLTASDMRFLDLFEGDEYDRILVEVDTLTPFLKAGVDLTDRSSRVEANVYVWTALPETLEPSLWSYEEFMRDKAAAWIGNGTTHPDYAEVDRRRQMDGKIDYGTNAQDLPAFGKAMREKCFSFEKGFINLNHGGRGASPKIVMETMRKWRSKAEEAPDKFYRRDFFTALRTVKSRAADYLTCGEDEVTFVLNATTGVNIVLRSLHWQKGDCILYLQDLVYGACYNTLRYVQDHNRELGIRLIPIEGVFPISHSQLVDNARQTIEKTKATLQPGERIRLALIDGIASRPGVVIPWEELCVLFREHDILSLVDAAHCMGQTSLNLGKSDPDFWVANAHKWCFAPRSLACLYVPKRNHHLIETFPTSFGYIASETPKTADHPSTFDGEFSYTGTQDVSNTLALPSALDFRLWCGGEKRIMDYNHNLVIKGADYIVKELETEVMQNDEGTLIACMANIRVPIPQSIKVEDYAKIADKLDWLLIDDYNVSASLVAYDGKVWIRICAQIYNEMSEYEYLAKCLKEILADPARLSL